MIYYSLILYQGNMVGFKGHPPNLFAWDLVIASGLPILTPTNGATVNVTLSQMYRHLKPRTKSLSSDYIWFRFKFGLTAANRKGTNSTNTDVNICNMFGLCKLICKLF